MTGEAEVAPTGTKQPVESHHDSNGASSSNQKAEVTKFESGKIISLNLMFWHILILQ